MPNESGNKLVNLADLKEAFDNIKKNATQTTAGLLSATDKAKLDGVAPGATANAGTVISVATGAGLTGGTITGSGTVKANLTSETKLTNAASDGTETPGRVYPVRLDKNGKLAVNVPWVDTNTTYTLSSLGIGNVKNYDQSKAIKSITRNGTTFTYTCLDNTTGTFTQQDNNTWTVMGGATSSSAGTAGIVPAPAAGKQGQYLRGDGTWQTPTNTNTTYSLTQDSSNGHKLTFKGSDGSSSTITIPDNNTTYTLSSLGIGNVKNYDQSKAIKSITRNGTTFTYTCLDNTTGTFTQQDNNTWTAMTGATSSANGTAGYVPAPPTAGYNTKYLRADGSWAVPSPAGIGAVAKTGDTMTGNLIVQKAETTIIRSSDSKSGTKVELVSADSGEHGVRSQGYYNGTAFTADVEWLIYRNTDGRVIVDGNISAPYIRFTDSDVDSGASVYNKLFNKLSSIKIMECALVHLTASVSKKLTNNKIQYPANGYVFRESTNLFRFVLARSTGSQQWCFSATIASSSLTLDTIYQYSGTAI